LSAVGFSSAGVRVAGIHLAGAEERFAGERGRPCVVMAHGFAGTVDSGLMPFAERYAAAGLDVLAFDYRHFGASGGEPRQLVSVSEQLADYAAAIAFARDLPGVDAERIVVWGSSFSGGHVVAVAAADPRIAAVISQVPSMDGRATLLNLIRYAGVAQVMRVTLAAIRDTIGARRGQPPVMVPVVAPPGTLAAMSTPDSEPGYLAITGPTWRNEVPARFGLTLGLYRPGLQAARLPCPMLVQIADRDAIAPPAAAQEAAWLATGRAEVRTYPLGHFDIYRGEAFERAVADQLHFLGRHLDAAGDPAAATATAFS
jgi:uncharacterized protein